MRPDGSTLRAFAADPPALLLAFGAVIAAAWAARTPATADLAAQAYRSDLFAAHGFLLWDNAWYGGHYIPGYSLLFPPLGAAVGLRLSGIVLVALAALAFAAVLRTTDVAGRRLASAWLAAALTGELLIGRLTFLMGLTVALGAVLLLARGRPRAAGAVARAGDGVQPGRRAVSRPRRCHGPPARSTHGGNPDDGRCRPAARGDRPRRP